MPSFPEEYFEFWELWAREEYFEAHEVLEEAWRRETDAARRLFFQGLIHCAVALVHAGRNNPRGAHSQLRKAEDKLARCGREYSRCDVGHRDVAQCDVAQCDVAALLQFVQRKLKEQWP